MTIVDQDISLVVQGPILGPSPAHLTPAITQAVCHRLRTLFPNSELILSVKEGTATQNISYDKLVITPDPGATPFLYRDNQTLHNCNRLITSTQAGLRAATRPYVLKLRSDLWVLSSSFLQFFDRFSFYDPAYRGVRSRILAFGIYSLTGETRGPLETQRPYHISDWAYFGDTEDLRRLYDVPLVPEPEFSQWFLHRLKHFPDLWPSRLWRMSPEEYITSRFFQSFYPTLNFDHTQDVSHHNVDLSQRLIANNFVVLNQTQFRLISLKHLNLQLLFDARLFRRSLFYHVWHQDYLQYAHVPRSLSFYGALWNSYVRAVGYKLLNALLRSINGRYHLIHRLFILILKWGIRR